MTAPTPLTRRRRIGIWALVVVATILLVLASATIFVKRQMLDNSAWKSASAKVIQDPEVRSALSVYLVNQLYANVDVAAALQERLPKNLDPLAAPAAAALRQPAVQSVDFMLQRPRVEQLFIQSSAIAHQKLINVLEDKTGYGVSTGNGVVTLDLSGLVTQLGSDLGLPADVLAKLPANTGTVTLMKSSQLSAAQNAVLVIKALSVWLVILVLALYALAVYFAHGHRRLLLRRVGWSFVLAGILLLVARKLAGNYIVDAISSPQYHGVSHRVWLIGTAILGQLGWAVVLYGVFILIGATLAGPTRPAVATRRAIAPTLNDRQGLAWSVVAFGFLLLVWWGPTHAFRTWWGILLVAGFLAAGVFALRRQTLVESPHAEPIAIPWHDLKRVVPARAHSASPASPSEELARLRDLHDAGTLSDEQYEKAKELVLT
jgi:hypothetical protein